MNLDQFKPKTVYVTYIATTPKKVWQALTTGDITKQFFFGRRIEIELQPGGAFRFWQPDGKLDVEGKVVVCDPPRKLSVTWRVMWFPILFPQFSVVGAKILVHYSLCFTYCTYYSFL